MLRTICLTLLSATLLAQQPATTPQDAAPKAPVRPPDGGTSEVLESIYIPPKPGAPFALTLNTEWVRTYADGNTTTVTNHRFIARDIQGRIFEERRLLGPVGSRGNSYLSWWQHGDPAAHVFYNCHPYKKVCYMLPYNDPVDVDPTFDPGVQSFPAGSTTREDLGRRFILGIDTHGVRVTTTLKPGVLGNSQPWVITREYWYSEQLGINLLSIRNDPRSGHQTFTVAEISTAPPDPKLFDLPDGFPIIDQRAPNQK